ncbi:hypothetical protein [Burkholderia sp. TSV86]
MKILGWGGNGFWLLLKRLEAVRGRGAQREVEV